MANQKIVPLKQYNIPALSYELTDVDIVRQEHTERDHLVDEIRRLRDKIYRMEAVLMDEVRMWKRGLETGEWEPLATVHRRINRLQGAIDYPGRADSAVIDTTKPAT